MATLIFFLVVWGIIKAIKAGSSRPVKTSSAPAQTKVTRSLAALEALQAQRDMLEQMISDYRYQLDYAQLSSVQYEKTQNQLVSAYGKLAVCEAKISKLIA